MFRASSDNSIENVKLRRVTRTSEDRYSTSLNEGVMEDRLTRAIVLVLPILVAVCAYLTAWLVKRHWIRRVASLIVAGVLITVGWFGTFRYAIPALEDFHNARVPLGHAIAANLIFWVICISAWVVAVRCTLFALQKNNTKRSS